MKYSTAKSILKVYRSEGRTNKIPKSQRYLSVRDLEDDFDDLYYEKSKQTNKTQSLEENISTTYRGPSTRLRTGKVKPQAYPEVNPPVQKLTEEAGEPPLTKKIHKEAPNNNGSDITVKVEPEVKIEETTAENTQPPSQVAKQEEKETTTETAVTSAQPTTADTDKEIDSEQIRYLEHIKEALEHYAPKPVTPINFFIPTVIPTNYNQSLLSNLMMLRAQELVLEIHTLKQQQQRILAKKSGPELLEVVKSK